MVIKQYPLCTWTLNLPSRPGHLQPSHIWSSFPVGGVLSLSILFTHNSWPARPHTFAPYLPSLSSSHPLAGFCCPRPASTLSLDLVDDKCDFSDLAQVLWTPPVALSALGNAPQSASWLVLLPGNWTDPFFSTLRYQPSFLLICPMLIKYL